MSVNYHVFSSIHTSLLLGNPPIWSCVCYSTGKQFQHSYNIATPVRKNFVRQIARRNYRSFSATAMKSQAVYKPMVTEPSRKCKTEMRDFASSEHDSILRDTREAVKRFSWETVMLEFERKLPTLVLLLKGIIPNPQNQRPLLSQIVKSRHQQLRLVQRVISVMFYGNGTSKQVMWERWGYDILTKLFLYDFPQENVLFSEKKKILVISSSQ